MKLGRFETNKIYNEDSYLAIKELPDKCIDCIVMKWFVDYRFRDRKNETKIMN